MLKKILDNFEECLVTPLMAALSVLVFLQVASRFYLHIPMPWVEELMRVLFIWTIMLSASIGIKRKAHLGVTMFMNPLPRVAQAICYYFGCVVILATCVLFIYATWDIMMMQKGSNQNLISMPVPIYFSTLALPVGFALVIIRTVQLAIKAGKEASFF